MTAMTSDTQQRCERDSLTARYIREGRACCTFCAFADLQPTDERPELIRG